MTNPHAVRWATRPNKFKEDGMDYGKWHWTEDANITVCGLAIRIANERGTTIPDTDEERSKVDCKFCLRKLEEQTP